MWNEEGEAIESVQWEYMILEATPGNYDIWDNRYNCTTSQYLKKLGLEGWEAYAVFPTQTLKQEELYPGIVDIEVIQIALKRKLYP